MRTKTKIRIYNILSAVLVAGGCLVAISSAVTQTGQTVARFNAAKSNETNIAESDSKLTIAEFGDLFEKRIQGQPKPPPPEPEPVTKDIAKQAPVVDPKPVLVQLPSMTLTAILYSSTYSLATFEVSGRSVLGTVGEEVAGARIDQIGPKEVTLSYRGQTFSKVLQN